jgi:hypothetical protein
MQIEGVKEERRKTSVRCVVKPEDDTDTVLDV